MQWLVTLLCKSSFPTGYMRGRGQNVNIIIINYFQVCVNRVYDLQFLFHTRRVDLVNYYGKFTSEKK